MKTYSIEIQRIKAMANSHGLVHAHIDALVQPATTPEGKVPTTLLTLSEDNARVLQQLLKAQLAEIDKRKARSQR